jgi:hypothetical protein
MLCLNGQTFSSRPEKNSGLPKDRIRNKNVVKRKLEGSEEGRMEARILEPVLAF